MQAPKRPSATCAQLLARTRWQADCLAVQKAKKAEELMSSDEDSSDEGQMQAPKKAKRKVS